MFRLDKQDNNVTPSKILQPSCLNTSSQASSSSSIVHKVDCKTLFPKIDISNTPDGNNSMTITAMPKDADTGDDDKDDDANKKSKLPKYIKIKVNNFGPHKNLTRTKIIRVLPERPTDGR